MRTALKHTALAVSLLWLAGCLNSKTSTIMRAPPPPSALLEARQLADTDAIGQAGQIETLLLGLDNQTLGQQAARLSAQDPLYPHMARVMVWRGLAPPHSLPGGPDVGQREAADHDGYRPPRKVALLLPLSGNLATPARPVRDGFMAAYYAESRNRPAVAFYDTSRGGAVQAYQRAVREGSDYVVGPLGRDEVDAVLAQGTLPVPLLALNRGSRMPPQGSIGFSLSPEDEGIASAEYLLARNVRQVVLVAGGGDEPLQRAAQAFAERFAARGGEVVGQITLAAGNAGFANLLAEAVGGAQIGGVFLAVRGEQARAILPVLRRQSGLLQVPVIAVSQIVGGAGRGEEARVLDGIMVPGESLNGQKLTAEAAGQARRGAAGRLFAFGHDAWLITAYPERMSNLGAGALNGATGQLRLDSGNVLRMPKWSVLNGGVAVPLER